MLRLCFFIFFFSWKLSAATLLIDPGHGGEDLGARQWIETEGVKRMVFEKDVALDLAKKIQELLKDEFNVYLTRSVDRTMSLDERAKMAEKVQADLFISIHLNADENKTARGIETFYLDNHDDRAVRRLEQLENKEVDGKEAVVNQILADIVITHNAPRSKALSEKIHNLLMKNLKVKFNIRDRGIKPGLFYVLAMSKVPAVLLEVGFLTNQDDAKKIFNPKFQEIYARSVADALRTYIHTEKNQAVSLNF
jgi:N-acetylmuramoyl-L-alanine amidase